MGLSSANTQVILLTFMHFNELLFKMQKMDALVPSGAPSLKFN